MDLIRNCSNCCEPGKGLRFDRYELISDHIVPDVPIAIWRCSGCGMALDNAEFAELEEVS